MAALVLSFHGALWLGRDAEGAWGAVARRLHHPVGVAVAVLTAASFWVQPHIVERASSMPSRAYIPSSR